MADRVVPLSRQTAYVPHARCQNCNKPGHWTHECTAGVQTFTARPTKNKKKLNEELPPEVKVSQLLQDTYHDGKPLHGLGAEGSANGEVVDTSTAMVATSASIDGKTPGSAGGNGHTGGSSSLEQYDVGNGKHTATGRASGEIDLNASDTRVIEEHRRDSAGGGPHQTDKRDKDQRSPGSPGMRVRGRGNVRGRGAAHFSANDADNFFHKRLTQEERMSMEENNARAGLGMLGNKGGKGGGNKGKGKLYGNPNASYQQHHQKMADHRGGPAGSQHDDGFRSSYKMNADNDRREHTPQNKRIELLPRVRSPTHGHAAPPPGRGNDSRRAAGTTSGSHHINQRQYPGATRGRHPPRSSNRSVADSSSSDDKNSDSSESESDSSSDSGQSARADHVQDVRRPMSSHNSTRVGGAGGNHGKKDRSAANSRSDGLRERETVATNKQHKEQAAAHAAASTTKGNTTISDRAAALRDRMKAAGTLRDRDEDARAGGGTKEKKPASKVAEKSENASKKRPRSGSRKHVRKERSATASSDQSDSGDEESAEQKPPKLKPKQARKVDNDKDQQRSMKSAAAGKDDRGRGGAKSNGNPISGNQDRDRRTGASNQDRKDTKDQQHRGDHTKTRSRDRGEKQPKNKSGTSSATFSNTKDNKNSSGAGTRATRAQSGDHAGGKTARAAGGRAPAPATSSRNAGQQGHNKNKNTSRGNKNKMNNRDQESESESSESGSSESEGSESASESSGSSSSSESEQPRAKRARKN
eukprot:g5666.t1